MFYQSPAGKYNIWRTAGPVLFLALAMVIAACEKSTPPAEPVALGPDGKPPPSAASFAQAGAQPTEVMGAGTPVVRTMPTPDGPPPAAPVLPAEQAVPAGECKQMCRLCALLVDCEIPRAGRYAQCYKGCLNSCRHNQVSRAFQQCLATTTDCDEIKKKCVPLDWYMSGGGQE